MSRFNDFPAIFQSKTLSDSPQYSLILFAMPWSGMKANPFSCFVPPGWNMLNVLEVIVPDFVDAYNINFHHFHFLFAVF